MAGQRLLTTTPLYYCNWDSLQENTSQPDEGEPGENTERINTRTLVNNDKDRRNDVRWYKPKTITVKTTITFFTDSSTRATTKKRFDSKLVCITGQARRTRHFPRSARQAWIVRSCYAGYSKFFSRILVKYTPWKASLCIFSTRKVSTVICNERG